MTAHRRLPLLFQVLSLWAAAAILLSNVALAQKPEADLAAMISSVKLKFSDVPHVETDGVLKSLNSKTDPSPQIIDAREPAEYAVGHIAGAINVPPSTADPDLLAAIDATRPVIVYCSVGYRSAILIRRLQAAGRRNATNYAGSIFAWANAGHPLQSANGATTTVHPYDKTWGKYLVPDKRAE